MAALLAEMNDAAHAARAGGRTSLSKRVLADFLTRYDAIVEAGLLANPAPVGRQRDYLERKSFNLVSALEMLKVEATRFAHDLRIPMTNNEAERSLRMAKLHHKISGCFQSDDGARHFATIRSYLSTARKHDVGALDALLNCSAARRGCRRGLPETKRRRCAAHLLHTSWHTQQRDHSLSLPSTFTQTSIM